MAGAGGGAAGRGNGDGDVFPGPSGSETLGGGGAAAALCAIPIFAPLTVSVRTSAEPNAARLVILRRILNPYPPSLAAPACCAAGIPFRRAASLPSEYS